MILVDCTFSAVFEGRHIVYNNERVYDPPGTEIKKIRNGERTHKAINHNSITRIFP